MKPEILKAIDEAHEALKPISERSPMYDVREVAKILMRLAETMRGDEKKTELSPRHHP